PGSNDRLLELPTYNSIVLNTQITKSKVYNILKNAHIKYIKENLIKKGYSEEDADSLSLTMSENNLKAYNKVDQTDAQVYISSDMMRAISIRLGEWSSKKQRAFELLN